MERTPTHLVDWLRHGYTHCQNGGQEWCEGYLTSAADEIERLRATIAEHEAAIAENPDALNLWRFWAQKARDLAAENKRLSERLREAFGGSFSYPVGK